jgi:hypothetical protein
MEENAKLYGNERIFACHREMKTTSSPALHCGEEVESRYRFSPAGHFFSLAVTLSTFTSLSHFT